jgi:heme-degrading monooxygenase HmoA
MAGDSNVRRRDGECLDLIAAPDEDHPRTGAIDIPPTKGVRAMIVMFSARRLKPGSFDQFRRAWDPGAEKPPGFQRAYHARNIRDEDEVISFGLFDMSIDDYHRWRAEADAAENERVDRLSAYVENEHVSGVYEVIDVVDE